MYQHALYFLDFSPFSFWESGEQLLSLLLTPWGLWGVSFIQCTVALFEVEAPQSHTYPLHHLMCSSAHLPGSFFSMPSFTPTLPSFIRVRPLEPLPPFPGGHPLQSPLRYRGWAMWQPSSSAHYRPRWAHGEHGTVEHSSAFTDSFQGFPFPELGRLRFLPLYVRFHREKPTKAWLKIKILLGGAEKTQTFITICPNF